MATKESSSSPDGIPYSFQRCAGGFGSKVLFNAYEHVLDGVATPALFAESRTVFIPRSSDAHNNGLIERSLEAFRPLTLCNLRLQDTHHSNLWRPSLVHREMHTPFEKMYVSQTDG